MKEKIKTLHKPKLLMFENDPFVTDVYKREFQEAGFEVRNFNTYKHVVEIVGKEKPDIISCDITIEPINGWEAIAMLKKDERTKNIPIFIVDNMCQKEDVQKGLDVGASDFLCKAWYTPKQITKFFQDYLMRTKESQENKPSKREKEYWEERENELEKIIEKQSQREFIESIIIMLPGLHVPLIHIKDCSELLEKGESKGKEKVIYKRLSNALERAMNGYRYLYNFIGAYYKENSRIEEMSKIKIIKGDITKVKTEAIVNSAAKELLGGGGVDGKIHEAAGPKLFAECLKLGGCKTGQAKLTKGYNLPAKYVIHTVGPIWVDGEENEEEDLASCYRNCLNVAVDNNIKSIAFPSISTHSLRFPIEKAAPIALSEVKKFLEANDKIEEVVFVLYYEKDFQIYQDLYNKIFKK